MMRAVLFWVFACVYSHNNLYAQLGSTDLLIKKFGVKDGLPNQTILDIVQDSRGYLWIGTASGMARFDGRHFVSYGISHGLKENYTASMFQDRWERIWVYSRHFVHIFDGQRFHHYPFADGAKPGYIFGMHQMKDGAIYVLTDNGTFVLQEKTWVRRPLVAAHAYSTCRQVLTHPQGLLINYSHVVVLLRPDGRCDTLAQAPRWHSGSVWFNTIQCYNSHVYLVARDGIYKQASGWRFIRIFNNARMPSLYSFQQDRQNRCWIYYTGDYAISVYDNETFNKPTSSIPLAVNFYSGFLQDQKGNYWLRTGDGLQQVLQEKVHRISAAAAGIDGIMAIVPHAPSGLIIFSANSGVFQLKNGGIKKNSGWSKAFKRSKNLYDFPDEWICDKRGNIWMITRGEQLMQIAEGKARNCGDSWGLSYKYNTLCYMPEQDALLLGGWGMVMLDALLGKPKRVLLPPEKDRIAHVAALGKNAIVYNTEQGPMRQIDTLGQANKNPFVIQKLHPPYGFPFFKTTNNHLFIYNTGDGIALVNPNGKNEKINVVYANEENGLAQRVVNAAAQDSMSQFWLAGTAGIELLRINNDTAIEALPIFDKQLFQNDFANYNRLATDDKGRVWLSSYSNVYGFNPSDIKPATLPPGVNIEMVKLLNSHKDIYDFSRGFTAYNYLPLHPVLPAAANTVEIFYNAVAPGYSGPVWYRYRLIHTDSTWSEPTKQTSVIFDRLGHGNYRFEVQAMTSGKVWSEADAYAFTIEPYVYNRWWFKGLSLFLALALALLIFGKRIAAVRRQERVKQEMMRLEMTALKAQMNPHFIYNALNSIQSLVVQKHDDEAIEYIGTFSRLLRQVLNQSDQPSITLQEELNTLKNYIALEELRLGKTLQYDLQVAENIDLQRESIPPLTLQPIVENALWHGIGKKKEAGQLIIAIARKEKYTVVTIRDDGIGRSAIKKHDTPDGNTSKGIAITRERLQHFNNNLLQEPILITDLYDSNGKPSGTAVTLFILSLSHIIQ